MELSAKENDERKAMTKTELMERLESYSEDEHLAIVWFDKEEIAEEMDDEEWEERCDDLLISDTIKQVAEEVMMS